MQYNILSGWARGGTSALMTAIKQSGIPILGFKYPFKYSFDRMDEDNKKVIKTVHRDGGLLEPLRSSKLVNPTGYWEVPSICLKTGLQKDHYDLGFDGDVVKVLFNVVPPSNPDLINKVVIILRHPASVIRSQCKTKSEGSKKEVNLEEWTKILSVGMLHNAVLSLKWFTKYGKEFKIIKYEDLLENPERELKKICDFLGRGSYKLGAQVIDRGLNRSKPIISSDKDFKEVIDFYKNPMDFDKYDLEELRKKIKKLDKKSRLTDVRKLKQ